MAKAYVTRHELYEIKDKGTINAKMGPVKKADVTTEKLEDPNNEDRVIKVTEIDIEGLKEQQAIDKVQAEVKKDNEKATIRAFGRINWKG